LVELEKLAALQCTDEEVAHWFGVTTRTIENRRKDPTFLGAIQRGRARGRISVRRSQMKLLEAGNATMAVWLGKQLLGQRDSATTEHVGPGGGAIEFAVKPDLSRLSNDELIHLREIAEKALPNSGDRHGTG
jgi:hypothetical protein